ncbi:MAG: hypothetical protein QGI45_17370, partial [Myxococcota bacterium]|nr:hypothetical protein [Myxococcota bacterium]
MSDVTGGNNINPNQVMDTAMPDNYASQVLKVAGAAMGVSSALDSLDAYYAALTALLSQPPSAKGENEEQSAYDTRMKAYDDKIKQALQNINKGVDKLTKAINKYNTELAKLPVEQRKDKKI